jgi:hypothetical protein
MLVTVKTFNGHAINNGSNYVVAGININNLPGAKPLFIEQAKADSVDSGTFGVDVRNLPVEIRIANYANRDALASQLKTWFKRGTQGDLVVKIHEDGQDYRMPCRVVNLVQEQNHSLVWTAILQSGSTDWVAVTADTDTWTATGTGGTKAIAVAGNDETRLSLSITPTVAPVLGYPYQRLYRLSGANGFSLGKWPWCLTLDHAALVTGGKSLASGYDLRPVVDGVEVPRWVASPNTSSTKIWIVVDAGQYRSMTLQTPIASSGDIDEIVFAPTVANKIALDALPAQGIVYHGTEWFAYSAKNSATYQLTGTKRGLYGTAKQAHSASDVFVFLPHSIVLKYGDLTATTPDANNPNYDLEKPLFDLASSDNTKWAYTASTKFYDPARPSAPGSWRPILQRLGKVSKNYYYAQDAVSGTPAAGGKAACFKVGSKWKPEDAQAGWMLYCPGGFSKISIAGSKYRTTDRWPDGINGCQGSADGATWYQVFAEAKPVAALSWTAFTQSSVSVSSAYKFLFVGVDGKMAALANASASLEALTATAEFVTANFPAGSLLAETINANLDVIVENQTTGDRLRIKLPMLLNTSLALDGEAYTVQYDSANAYDAMALDDESRATWIRLQPGGNTLAISSADLGTLQIALSWKRRRL